MGGSLWRRYRSRAVALAVALAAPGVISGSSGATSAAIGEEAVVTGLDYPAAFTIAGDGRIFYGELLTGEIRVFDPSTGSDTLFYKVPGLISGGERGLLGLALSPRYPSSPHIFFYATRLVEGEPRNVIGRVTDTGRAGADERVLWTENRLAATNHNGGRILFGPGGRLFAIVGDASSPSNAQTLEADAGKVLRMTARGSVPPDNPFPGSLVWAYGIRNSFGFTFDPQTGALWETENGPQCNDELNRIESGLNYGWGPSWTCSEPPPPPQNTNQDGPDPQLPLAWFTPTPVPTGAAFCRRCGLPGASGTMFFGLAQLGQIRQVVLTPDRKEIESITTVLTHDSVLSLERGPDRAIYFSDPTGIFKLVAA